MLITEKKIVEHHSYEPKSFLDLQHIVIDPAIYGAWGVAAFIAQGINATKVTINNLRIEDRPADSTIPYVHGAIVYEVIVEWEAPGTEAMFLPAIPIIVWYAIAAAIVILGIAIAYFFIKAAPEGGIEKIIVYLVGGALILGFLYIYAQQKGYLKGGK